MNYNSFGISEEYLSPTKRSLAQEKIEDFDEWEFPSELNGESDYNLDIESGFGQEVAKETVQVQKYLNECSFHRIKANEAEERMKAVAPRIQQLEQMVVELQSMLLSGRNSTKGAVEDDVRVAQELRMELDRQRNIYDAKLYGHAMEIERLGLELAEAQTLLNIEVKESNVLKEKVLALSNKISELKELTKDLGQKARKHDILTKSLEKSQQSAEKYKSENRTLVEKQRGAELRILHLEESMAFFEKNKSLGEYNVYNEMLTQISNVNDGKVTELELEIESQKRTIKYLSDEIERLKTQ